MSTSRHDAIGCVANELSHSGADAVRHVHWLTRCGLPPLYKSGSKTQLTAKLWRSLKMRRVHSTDFQPAVESLHHTKVTVRFLIV